MHFSHLKRRDFITLLGAAAAWPLQAGAQEPGRTYRLGSVHASPRDAPYHVAFFAELRRLGFIEGQNLAVDGRGYGLRVEQFEKHAAELVKAQVDVIVAGGDAAVRATQRATARIPILALTDDMVGQGFVRSLAKPGGSTTGVTILASELDGKRQEILMEAVPGVRRIAALADTNVTTPSRLRAGRRRARTRIDHPWLRGREEICACGQCGKSRTPGDQHAGVSSLLQQSHDHFRPHCDAEPARRGQWLEWAEEGGLIGYGPRLVHLFRDVMSRQLAALLRGTKPADLPVEQPTTFELVINLQAAKAIGHEVPAGLVLRADRVIE
jgi:putative ABC transport system substrate-binding protein